MAKNKDLKKSLSFERTCKEMAMLIVMRAAMSKAAKPKKGQVTLEIQKDLLESCHEYCFQNLYHFTKTIEQLQREVNKQFRNNICTL